MENIILIIFMLNIESSYLENIERSATPPADTVQFALIKGQAWRIKTYAIDHDVHVWGLGPMELDKFNELAVSNTEKHYGDVLHKKTTIQSRNGLEELKSELKKSGLPVNLEIPKSKEFVFWVPEPNVYKSKSTPK